MKQNKNNDNLHVAVSNKETWNPDADPNAYGMEKEIGANLNDGGNDQDDDEYLDEEDMSQEEADALDHLLGDAFNAEIQYLTNKGKHLESVSFSEQYEAKMQVILEQYLGKEKADQLMLERAIRDGKAVAAQAQEPVPEKDIREKDVLQKDILQKEMPQKTSFWMRPGQWWNGLKMKPAIVLACVFIVCSIAVMSVDALKTPITRFLFEDEPEYTVLTPESENSDEESPETIEKKYVPGKVLDGFEKVERIEVSKILKIRYEKDEQDYYQFEQATRDVQAWIDIEDTNIKKYDTVFGDAFYYEKDEIHKLVWSYEGYVFKLEGTLSRDEMVDLANSLGLEQ